MDQAAARRNLPSDTRRTEPWWLGLVPPANAVTARSSGAQTGRSLSSVVVPSAVRWVMATRSTQVVPPSQDPCTLASVVGLVAPPDWVRLKTSRKLIWWSSASSLPSGMTL